MQVMNTGTASQGITDKDGIHIIYRLDYGTSCRNPTCNLLTHWHLMVKPYSLLRASA